MLITRGDGIAIMFQFLTLLARDHKWVQRGLKYECPLGAGELPHVKEVGFLEYLCVHLRFVTHHYLTLLPTSQTELAIKWLHGMNDAVPPKSKHKSKTAVNQSTNSWRLPGFIAVVPPKSRDKSMNAVSQSARSATYGDNGSDVASGEQNADNQDSCASGCNLYLNI